MTTHFSFSDIIIGTVPLFDVIVFVSNVTSFNMNIDAKCSNENMVAMSFDNPRPYVDNLCCWVKAGVQLEILKHSRPFFF